ncbi:3201_t:CDS:1 [Ambispora leptoticha]|uniref:3201_t:CDS:1 n=1 Tax=Ambispora leptoticha TaxID=144679 RepID=A0A9N8W5A4_9GLOM|nr:3201_t:CDS:1 [Ambispora leptoticha]
MIKRISSTIFLSRQRFVLEATLLQSQLRDQFNFEHSQLRDQLNFEHKQEILDILNQHKQEILKVQDQLQVRHKQEIILMKEKLQSLQNEKRDYIILYLKIRGNFNIRGVLEWIREQISRGNFGDYELLFLTPTASPLTKSSTKPLSESPTKESTEPPKKFSATPDSNLTKLINNHEFVYYLKNICDINKTKEDDVKKCISFLYHQVSKYAHGYNTDEVTIDERFFAPYEVLALGYIFKIYNIRYLYYDKYGKPADFPFEI